MDPLHFCIAVSPLAVYLLMLGLLNLKGRPFSISGARDAAALGIGLVGLVIAGPMELFFPEGAASRFGPWVWLMLVVFYGLCVSLLVLLLRPRIVIYNISLEELRPILTAVALKMDPKSRWTGDSLIIPTERVHLHVESVEWLRNIQLTSGGSQQSHDGWRTLESELKTALQKVRVGPGLIGIPLMVGSALIALAAAAWMLNDQQGVADALENFVRK